MFSAETLQKFDREVAKYPADQKQSAVMACLALAQEEKGWLPPEAIEAVAAYLGMPPMAAYEVATFYNMYDLRPVCLARCPAAITPANMCRKSSASATGKPLPTASSR